MMNRVLTGALAVGAMAASASATNLALTFVNVSPGVSIQYSTNGGANWSGTTAGVFNWQGGYKTFCTQLGEYISGGQTVNYTCVTPDQVPDAPPGNMGVARAQVLQTLYALKYNAGMLADATKAAAFQSIVWEISHDSTLNNTSFATVAAGLSLTAGSFQTDLTGARTLAQTWIGDIQAAGFMAFTDLVGLTDPSYQDQLIVVPLPAPALLAGLGLLGAVAVRRRVAKA